MAVFAAASGTQVASAAVFQMGTQAGESIKPEASLSSATSPGLVRVLGHCRARVGNTTAVVTVRYKSHGSKPQGTLLLVHQVCSSRRPRTRIHVRAGRTAQQLLQWRVRRQLGDLHASLWGGNHHQRTPESSSSVSRTLPQLQQALLIGEGAESTWASRIPTPTSHSQHPGHQPGQETLGALWPRVVQAQTHKRACDASSAQANTCNRPGRQHGAGQTHPHQSMQLLVVGAWHSPRSDAQHTAVLCNTQQATSTSSTAWLAWSHSRPAMLIVCRARKQMASATQTHTDCDQKAKASPATQQATHTRTSLTPTTWSAGVPLHTHTQHRL